MSNFFQNLQNHSIWNFEYCFLSRGKKASCKLLFIWMQAHHNEKLKELVNLFVILRQSDSSAERKVVNYWAEICKLLPRDIKNVVLYTVTI